MAYKRRIYLINPHFQLRMSFYIAFFVFVTSLLYPFIIYDLLGNIAVKLSVIKPELVDSLYAKRSEIVTLLAIIQTIFFVLDFEQICVG